MARLKVVIGRGLRPMIQRRGPTEPVVPTDATLDTTLWTWDATDVTMDMETA